MLRYRCSRRLSRADGTLTQSVLSEGFKALQALRVGISERPASPFVEAPKTLLIGGEPVVPKSGETLTVVNPATEERVCDVPIAGVSEVDAAVSAARAAFENPAWSDMEPYRRSRLLNEIADIMEAHASELAILDSIEMGGPLPLTQGMVNHSVEVLRHFAGWPTKNYGELAPSSASSLHFTIRQPLGVVVGIAGWNGPILQMTYKLAPALATGNTVVLKPSEHSSLSILRFGELLRESSIPPGVVNVVTGAGAEVGEALIRHDGVAKISFTGSSTTGKHVLAVASDRLKRVTLELGGKSPFVVFDDADLTAAAVAAAAGFCAGSGQACTTASRILIHEAVKEEFVEKLVEEVERWVPGDPFHPGTRMGPMAFRGHYDRVCSYVDSARADGARFLTGSGTIDGPGWFMPGILLDGIDRGAKVWREEIFGPVSVLDSFGTLSEAISKANDTQYGLVATVWTKDMQTAHAAARGIQAGTVGINGRQMAAGPLPFGGMKESGLGRENGTQVLDHYTEVKAVQFNSL